jgi:hypothetical protein
MLVKGIYSIGSYTEIQGKKYLAVSTRDSYTRLVPLIENLNQASLKIENQRKEIEYLNATLDDLREYLSEYLELIEDRISLLEK